MVGVRPPARGGGEEPLRLFVAVILPDAWLAALAAMQASLRRAGLDLRYVRPEGIHLTLKFLGETPAARLTEVENALVTVVAGARPCRIALGGGGTFGPARRPRVVWCDVEGDAPALVALAGAIDAALAADGFAREARPLSPHLTLARVPDRLPPSEAERIAPAAHALRAAAVPPFTVERIALMRSELGRGGARYTALREWRLGEQATR
jgi:RNA 2',3'-cyclic 3'-phosphodiesterase